MSTRGLADAFTLDETRKQFQDRPLRASSAGRGWMGVACDEYGAVRVDQYQRMPARDHNVVTIALGQSPYVFQERLGKTFETPSRRGEATLIPAGYETAWRGLLPAHLRIAISPESLLEAGEEIRAIGTRVDADLANGFRVRDPWLDNAGAIFSLELDRGPHPAQTLLVESLSAALLVHLLRRYSPGTAPSESSSEAATAAVRRAIDYLESHKHGQVTLMELASASGLSRFHLIRVFKRQVGVSPMQYLEGLRVERAKDLIRQAEITLAQIADAVGFSDQSHFTRRFKRHIGCTPGAFAREHGRRRPYSTT
jgi:AraC family transcriptional regulator